MIGGRVGFPVQGRTKWVPTSSTTVWISLVTLPVVAVCTYILWLIGPVPERATTVTALWPEQNINAFSEPTDRLILLVWFLLPVILFIVILVLSRSTRNLNKKLQSLLIAVLLLLTASLAILALQLTQDGWGFWAGFTRFSFLSGAIVTLVIFSSWIVSRSFYWISAMLVAIIAAAFLIPALLQSESHVRDPYNFLFTGNELAAPSVDFYPLGNFVAQYSNLLGYPIAPILKAFPDNSINILLAWIIFLQVVLIIGIISLPIIVAGNRMLIGAMILGVSPLIVTGAYMTEGPLTYFANIPLRTVLPVTLILVTVLVLPRAHSHKRLWWTSFSLGAFSGITGLNNIDFGLPAAFVVFLAVVFSAFSIGKFIFSAFAFSIGFALPFLIYSIFLHLNGTGLDSQTFLFYARIFGISGLYLVPMDGFGLHILVVSLFVASLLIGLVIFLDARKHPLSVGYKQGLALFLAGSWGLLTLPYFSGRSLVPTLFGGYAVQTALVAVAFLPLVRASFWRLLSCNQSSRTFSLAPVLMSFILVGIIGGLLSYARTPTEAFDDYFKSKPVFQIENGIEAMNHASIKFASSSTNAQIAQVIHGSNIVQLEGGFISVLGFNSPETLSIAPAFTDRQCELFDSSKYADVVIELEFFNYLIRDYDCATYIKQHIAKTFTVKDTKYIIMTLVGHQVSVNKRDSD